MSEHAEDEHAISVSELQQEVLEMGLIAHLLANFNRTSLFMYSIINITPSCFRDPVARRVYCAILQGISASDQSRVSMPVEDINIGVTDALALSYIRQAVAGGYPCTHSLAPCLLELHDRAVLAKLEYEADIDDEWQQLSQEYVPGDDPDEMPW